ncbi:MAG TPA: 23S rRNA (uracil(1939)-C(5))-methyltransferase RlmD, partial [Chitinophagaceae bacterium]|nr:23S rRNA (uracil(1939)-C(5))-methyltransferase RlmD [Chitinophagaceae bacterium]
LRISEYAAEGKCIARHEQKVIFVEGVIPGDVADVWVHRNKKDWAEATVVRFREYSDIRVDAFCSHFNSCGGCKWQHLPYELQLQYKEKQVRDQLERIGKAQVQEWLPIQGASRERFYRNKLEFTFSNKQYLSREQLNTGMSFDQNVLGFHAPRLFDKVIDISACHLQENPSNAIRNFVREYALAHQLSFYDIRQHQGFLRNLIIRNSTLNQVMVNLVVHEKEETLLFPLLDALHTRFPEITSLQYTVNPKLNDTLYDLEVICYAGTPTIDEQLGPYTFRISPKSFFQTNSYQAKVLYDIVKEMAGCQGHETLYDLYCGTGSIGIYLSASIGKLIGVDSVDDAIQDARENVTLNGLQHAHFYSGDVIKICNDSFFNEHGKPDVVIIDPPRAGCHDHLLNKLLEIAAPRIVYVSCNPATQARDLQLLGTKYTISKSRAVDMFPHTHHVENVIQLNRKEA